MEEVRGEQKSASCATARMNKLTVRQLRRAIEAGTQTIASHHKLVESTTAEKKEACLEHAWMRRENRRGNILESQFNQANLSRIGQCRAPALLTKSKWYGGSKVVLCLYVCPIVIPSNRSLVCKWSSRSPASAGNIGLSPFYSKSRENGVLRVVE